ncbi:dolichyl-diphosphooligosaccharide--protein glycosyltransferase [Salinigranum rubrum]|uniref:dolichyl-phosphooligosaccharide-protein glycotransferase n=1 Tax=Salinigranum rubrum TaxID=755307 RepID=A0A2I8VIR4_9EURY|nr:oligosaccharyl transferase, archaeosortase A system-associated [Salinigranum rubrum]AUV81826.1 dolichyl-diphosphooligosaccharide--protein glycosyltransferase [Salinigranum rubrum]
MSQRSERAEDDGQSVLDIFEDWFHVPALLVVMVLMVAIRLQELDSFTRDGTVYFSGNDAWYHLREVNYTVRHWPTTMPFDPWTNFPYGTSVGQFGTLYDQLVATAALVVGLGAPSESVVSMTLLVAPAVFGALAVVPTYYLGERLGGRIGGLFGVVVLALLPGTFLQRTLVGFADHNGAEPFFQALAVLGIVVALAVAEREMPVWELVTTRDWDALRRPTLYAALGGVALAVYMWVWPPGVLLVGVLGLFTLVKLTSTVVAGKTPDPVAFAVAVVGAVAGVLMLLQLDTGGLATTQFSLLQPLAAFSVALAAVFLAFLARQWEHRDLDLSLYPVAVLGIVVVGVGVAAVVAPSVLGFVQTQLLRIVGFSQGATARTIGEAQPFLSPNLLQQQGVDATGRILIEYGFTLFTAVVATVWLLAKPLVDEGETRELAFLGGSLVVVALVFLVPNLFGAIGGVVGLNEQVTSLLVVSALIVGAALLADYDSERTFIVIWAAFITAAAFTQIRFNYYLAVVVAVMNAFLVGELLRYIDLRSVPDSLSDVKSWQVLTVIVVVMLVLAPVLVVPLNVRNTGNPSFDSSDTAWQAAQSNGPGNVVQWDGSLQWMERETPAEGTFGGASNEMDYYGTYERTDDFSYPEGSYGVQSWWDYGHWITLRSERIPNANPFQEGATEAANYLLAPSEEQAEEVLARQSEEGNETRFVMVDWQMASPNSKFGAPIVFYDDSNVSRGDFFEPMYTSNFQASVTVRDQRYYESQMVRLYHYHGSAVEPRPVVVDWENRQAQTTGGETVSVRTFPSNRTNAVREFQNMSTARAYVEQDGSAQIGGVGAIPEERVPALEHYRLVRTSSSSAFSVSSYQREFLIAQQLTGFPATQMFVTNPSWLKTFERVPGARVEGSGAPPNTTVTAEVDMRAPNGNYTFTYRQQARTNADGEFTMTLPYSTTGYDQYGPENGYTNVSVRAMGPYNISTGGTLVEINGSAGVEEYRTTADVSEGRVNGDQSGPIEVTLERQTSELTFSDTDSEDAPTDASASGDSASASSSADDSASDDTASTDGSADVAVRSSRLDSTAADNGVARVGVS